MNVSRSFTEALQTRRGQLLALACLTLLAFGLRLYKLGEWSLWIDEVFFLRRTRAMDTFPQMLWRLEPLSILTTRGALTLFGVNEWSARLAPALIGVLSVPLLYLPFRRLAGTRAALIALLLLAVSPWHLTWSQNARYYTALMVLYALASVAFFVAVEDGRRRHVALFIAFLLLAFRERSVALLLVPVVVAYLLLRWLFPGESTDGVRWRPLAALAVAGAGLVLADLAGYASRGYSEIVGGLVLQGDQGPVMDPARLATFIALDIGGPLAALALCGAIYGLTERSRTTLFLLLSAVLPVCLLLVANIFYFTNARYAFVTLPAWLLLAAMGIDRLFEFLRGQARWLAVGVLAAVVADAGTANLLYYRQDHGNRLDWRGAFAVARERSQEGDAFVSWWPEYGPYYLGQPILAWTDLTPFAVEQTGRRHWFVLDSETIWSNLALRSWVLEHAALVDVRHVRTTGGDNLIVGNQADLRVYLYDPSRQTTSRVDP